MQRREVLKFGIFGGSLFLSGLSGSIAFGRAQARARKLVVVFLYGGADPLSLFPPTGDDSYYVARPKLGVEKRNTLPLDHLFSLNSALSPLYPAWRSGEMTVVHQFGLPTAERSHIQASGLLETGVAPGQLVLPDGFLSRAMIEAFGAQMSPLTGLAVQLQSPKILSGSANMITFSSIEDLQLRPGGDQSLSRHIEAYQRSQDPSWNSFATKVLGAISEIRGKLGAAKVQTANSDIPFQELPFQLGEIRRLIQADLGVRLAFTSLENWDTHFVQANRMLPNMQQLGTGLADFRSQLTKSGHWDDTLVVVLTEFGRAARENGSGGSDHGHGSATILLGGSLKHGSGGKVLHRWKSLNPDDLSEARDIAVHYDYRDVFSEVLTSQLGLTQKQLLKVFPLHSYRKTDLKI